MATGLTPAAIATGRDGLHCQTIVIGAGPAGLAVAACLMRAGSSCLVLEQGNDVGETWQRHYERLHLHTDKAHSALPYVPFPRDYPRYPSRLQVIDYLRAYARHLALALRYAQRVVVARQSSGAWEVRTQDSCYRSSNLVIATGYNREPHIPAWPGQASFRPTLIHSSQYRNAAPFRGQKVLVVGFGNSGGEIAMDLWEHGAQASLAVRGPVNVIPRELLGIPICVIGIMQSRLPSRLSDALNSAILRAVVGDLSRYGLRKLPRGPMTQIRRDARIPLIDVGTIRLIKRGAVAVRTGIAGYTEEEVVFTDGSHERFDAVILATGYRPRVNTFLEGALAAHDEQGTPFASGRETPLPGLYFCGYCVPPTGMLREIGFEAQRIAAAIARQQLHCAPACC